MVIPEKHADHGGPPKVQSVDPVAFIAQVDTLDKLPELIGHDFVLLSRHQIRRRVTNANYGNHKIVGSQLVKNKHYSDSFLSEGNMKTHQFFK